MERNYLKFVEERHSVLQCMTGSLAATFSAMERECVSQSETLPIETLDPSDRGQIIQKALSMLYGESLKKAENGYWDKIWKKFIKLLGNFNFQQGGDL